MRLLMRAGCACLGILICSGSLFAADVAKLIPSSAAAVIRVKTPEKTIESLANFVDDVQQGYGGLIQGQAGMLGVGISNPSMKGVDKTKDFWGAVFLTEGEEPAVVFLIPATDIKAMEESVDEAFEFIAHEDVGIYTEDEKAATIIREHLKNPRAKSISDISSKKMTELVSEADFSFAFNLVEIKKAYKDELAEGKEKFLEGLEEAKDEMLEVPGMNLDWVPGLMETLGNKLFTAVKDSRGYAVTLSVKKTGLEFQEYLEFAEESESAKFLSNHPPEALDILKSLPAEQQIYGSIGGYFSDLNTWGLELVPQMLELSDEQKKEWAVLVKKFKDIEYGSTAGSFSLGDPKEGLLRVKSASHAKPTETVRNLAIEVSKAMESLELPGGMKQEISYEKEFEKVEGTSIDLMTTKQIIDGDNQFGGFQEQMNQILYGGDAIETRLAYLDGGIVLQTVGGGIEAMKQALNSYKAKSAGDDEIVARDLAPLGKENNAVAILDIPSLVVAGLKIAATSDLLPPMPFDEESLEDLEVERAYIGIGIATSKTGCHAKLHIPKQTIKASASLFFFFQTMQNPGNAF